MGQSKGKDINEWIPRCGRNRRGGKGPCNAVMMKNGKGCRIHGGKSVRGLAHPSTSDMPRYTEAVKNTKLGERFERARKDQALIEINDEIAIVQAMIEDIFERLSQGEESRVTIKTISKCYEDMVEAGLNKKWATYNKKMDQLGVLINEADHQFALQNDLQSAIKLKKDLADSQSKREIQLEQMMKAEDVVILIKVVLGEIRGVIYDRLDDKSMAAAVLAEIQEKVAGHLRGNARGRNSSALPEG